MKTSSQLARTPTLRHSTSISSCAPSNDPNDPLVSARQVCDHFFAGISDMTLWRWLRDPELGFPGLWSSTAAAIGEKTRSRFGWPHARATGRRKPTCPAPIRTAHRAARAVGLESAPLPKRRPLPKSLMRAQVSRLLGTPV